MKIDFYKYQGTGNDFVMIDNRNMDFPKANTALIAKLCDRRFGVGADGLILLENDEATDFRMLYYNADGKEGSMCGNGGRSIVAFAAHLRIIEAKTTFIAVDGLHEATVSKETIRLKMKDVPQLHTKPNAIFLNTGSPHHVQLVADLERFDVVKEGRKLRYGLYGEAGSNINFAEEKGNNEFAIRTYERGVEDETLSCGTGVTALALSMATLGKVVDNKVSVHAKGGNLEVTFEKDGAGFKNIFLSGKAEQVFKGVFL